MWKEGAPSGAVIGEPFQRRVVRPVCRSGRDRRDLAGRASDRVVPFPRSPAGRGSTSVRSQYLSDRFRLLSLLSGPAAGPGAIEIPGLSPGRPADHRLALADRLWTRAGDGVLAGRPPPAKTHGLLLNLA